MMDLLVQLAVAGAILVLVVLFMVTQEGRDDLRERLRRAGARRRWWNKPRNGH
ncbi:hypothetical protein [Paraburkholderia caledonica]|uniref:hypothetical protein n=1 Tax=Paraburkholderia caledonica TaxID=134536 RepID=UPI0012EB4B2B|nr:hypothetical protein [Paraburkholderia caledonica]